MNEFWFSIIHQYINIIPSASQVKGKNLKWAAKHVHMSKSNLDEII